jgi:hypothetical protein
MRSENITVWDFFDVLGHGTAHFVAVRLLSLHEL